MSDWEPLVDSNPGSPLAAKDHTNTVVIAMDGSEYSDYALQCKFSLKFSLYFHNSLKKQNCHAMDGRQIYHNCL